jgi:alkyl sulfatase BDS1-like metallo-beta-lactamase superfamily hydrolase
MADRTAEFFDRLGKRGVDPLLRKASGTVRFDLRNGTRTERWLVKLEKGEIAVSRRHAKADCVLSADRAVFERIATGKTNATAALLRQEVSVEGDVNLLVLFQRLLPGPASSQRRPGASAAAGSTP